MHGGTQFCGRKMQLSQEELHILWPDVGNFSQSGNICSSGRKIRVWTSQPGGSQSSDRKMWVSTSLDLSSANRVLKISPCQISFFQPEIGTWYLVYQGIQPWNHVWHGLVMGDHVRLSKSSLQNVVIFSKVGLIHNSPAGSWGLVLWSIRRTTINSPIPQPGYGRLHNTV